MQVAIMRIFGIALLAAIVLVCFMNWGTDPDPIGAPGHATASAATSSTSPAQAATLDVRTPLEPQVAPPPRISPDTAQPSNSYDEIDWRIKGREYLMTAAPGNDVGHKAVFHLLQRFLDNGCRLNSLVNSPTVSAKTLEGDRQINPTGHVLSDDERAQAQAIIDDFARKKQRAEEDIYITTQIGLSKAIIAGDFVTHPTPGPEADNSAEMKQAAESARSAFENSTDENITALPGIDGRTYRLIVLKPGVGDEYLAAKRRLQRLQAEEAIALRTLFLPVLKQR